MTHAQLDVFAGDVAALAERIDALTSRVEGISQSGHHPASTD